MGTIFITTLPDENEPREIGYLYVYKGFNSFLWYFVEAASLPDHYPVFPKDSYSKEILDIRDIKHQCKYFAYAWDRKWQIGTYGKFGRTK